MLTQCRLNGNVVSVIFWYILEALKDQALHDKIKKEVAFCSHGPSKKLEIDKVLSQPLLQSVYTEVLRLYVITFFTRAANCPDLTIGGYSIPTGHNIMVPTHITSFNADAWT